MERTLIIDTLKKIEEKVRLCGWVNTRRNHGKIVFLDLRDRTGVIQIIGDESLGGFRPEDVVEITGTVKQRPENLINPKMATGEIEIEAIEVKILAKAETLPFDLGSQELNLELPTHLDYRPLTLRHPKVQAIFKVQEVVIDSFREALLEKGFLEFQAPGIIPAVPEGGTEVFEVKYFEHKAYLSQSPQLYKSLLVSCFERVFSVNQIYRAEPSVTTRHLTEATSLDAEFGFIKDWVEVRDMAEYVIKYILSEVENKCAGEIEMYGATIPKVADKIPSVKLREAQQIIFERTGRDHRTEKDPDPEDEREICRWAFETYGSELVFISHYPTKTRPFYTYPDDENPEFNQGFDLIGRGVEWMTGGRRINNYQTLIAHAKEWGVDQNKIELYLQGFKYGMPPLGGFAFGAERITMHILGLSNIREASMFPRDMERIDIRLSTIGKATTINDDTVFEKLIKLFQENGVKYRLFDHEPVFTSEQAAEVRGTKLSQGAKALIMFADDKPAMLVVPADRKINNRRFKEIFKIKDLRLASPEEVEKLTGGTKIGAVPPFGNIFGLPVYLDKHLEENKEVVFNAGSHTKSVMIQYEDYCRLAKPIIGEFSATNPKH